MFRNHLSLNIALKRMVPLLRIPEIVGSDLDTETGDLEVFLFFSLVCTENCQGWALNEATATFFSIFSTHFSLFLSSPYVYIMTYR